MAQIAPHLPDPQEALTIIRELKNDDSRANALAEIALNLPDPLKTDVLIEALAAARKIKNENLRAEALAEIAPNLPDPLKTDVLIEALAAARKIKNENLRAEALAEIVPQLIEFSNSSMTLYSLWREYSQILARRTRSDFLSDLIMLVPVIAVLCNLKTIEEIVHDIKEVGRWWP